MNILLVDYQYPMFDRSSADLRAFSIVELLNKQGHKTTYFTSDIQKQEEVMGGEEVKRYRVALQDIGSLTVERQGFEELLSKNDFDVIAFKYYFQAEKYMKSARIWMPNAKIVVDSVDLVYERLFSKSEISGIESDRIKAESVMKKELAVYSESDVVITVTRDEADKLARKIDNVDLCVVPNIHEIPNVEFEKSDMPTLIFVGVFNHEPNVDAMIYFVREVWPNIKESVPEVRLTIVGGSLSNDIVGLSDDSIEVTGYVSDTLPYLKRSWVSIAPLRYGAGMKGKIGEAMAAGIPVVTTEIGAQGFGLIPDKHFLLANDATQFAMQVVRLIKDEGLRSTIATEARKYIELHYSPDAVNRSLREILDNLESMKPRSTIKHQSIKRITRVAKLWFNRNIFWRLHTPSR